MLDVGVWIQRVASVYFEKEKKSIVGLYQSHYLQVTWYKANINTEVTNDARAAEPSTCATVIIVQNNLDSLRQ